MFGNIHGRELACHSNTLEKQTMLTIMDWLRDKYIYRVLNEEMIEEVKQDIVVFCNVLHHQGKINSIFVDELIEFFVNNINMS